MVQLTTENRILVQSILDVDITVARLLLERIETGRYVAGNSSYLSSAFMWSDTIEGHNYWENINSKISERTWELRNEARQRDSLRTIGQGT